MLQHSKILRSREEWKRKAVERAEALREQRKTLRRYRHKIAQLQTDLSTLEAAAEEKKRRT
jgi:uncharacterized coiled-coil DUF342 family protein